MEGGAIEAFPVEVDGGAILNRGREHHRATRLDAALRCYEVAVCLHPGNADALHLLGACLALQERNEAAFDALVRTCRVEPGLPSAIQNLDVLSRILTQAAIAFHQEGRQEAALRLYAKVLSTGQSSEAVQVADANAASIQDALVQAARTALRAGDEARARQAGEILAASVPGADRCRLLQGLLALYRGDFADAVTWFTACRGQIGAGALAEDVVHLVNESAAKGDMETAAAYCRLGILVQPALPSFYSLMSQCLGGLRRRNEAVELALRAVRLKPDDALFAFLAGRAASEAFDFSRATRCLLEALRLKPAYTDASGLLQDIRAFRRFADRIVDFSPAGGERPCNIYIKCFNRPLYLERCIRSIKMNVTNYGSIVLLNDGIGEPFLSKILNDHPDVQVRQSLKVEAGILASPPNDLHIERKKHFRDLDYLDPVRFWTETVAEDEGDFIFLLEEDAWLIGQFDLQELTGWMRKNRAIAFAMWYGTQDEATFAQADPAFSVYRDVELRSLREKIGDLDSWHDWVEGYRVFPLAGSVIKKEYFLAGYHGVRHWADELHLMRNVLRIWSLIGQEPGIASAYMPSGIVWHTRNTTSRPDAGGCRAPIDVNLYNDAMSRAWHQGRIDPMADYPEEIPTDHIEAGIADGIDPGQARDWLVWREFYRRKFPHLGGEPARLEDLSA